MGGWGGLKASGIMARPTAGVKKLALMKILTLVRRPAIPLPWGAWARVEKNKKEEVPYVGTRPGGIYYIDCRTVSLRQWTTVCSFMRKMRGGGGSLRR